MCVCVCVCHTQGEGLVPAGVQRALDGLGLLLALALRVGDEFQFDVRIRRPVGVHWNEVTGLPD